MAGKQRWTIAQVADALRAGDGIYSLAAEKLGARSQSTIANYVGRYKALQKVEAEVLQDRLDLAESELLNAIRRGNMTAVIFYLKTKGKARGYTERHEVTGADGGSIKAEVDVKKRLVARIEKILSADGDPEGG